MVFQNAVAHEETSLAPSGASQAKPWIQLGQVCWYGVPDLLQFCDTGIVYIMDSSRRASGPPSGRKVKSAAAQLFVSNQSIQVDIFITVLLTSLGASFMYNNNTDIQYSTKEGLKGTGYRKTLTNTKYN